jgi:hypothetical protein
MLHLTESDLRFLVETVATSRRDYDHIVNLIRDKEDLLEPMLEDPKLTERLLRNEEALVRISPHLLFSVLLRRLRKELEKEAYILDLDTEGKRIPVFEGPAVAEMLSDKQTRDYLAEMLSSFARTNNGIIYWKERGAWHKRRFSDIDMDDMIELARVIEPEMRPGLYKRIADICAVSEWYFPRAYRFFCSSSKNRVLRQAHVKRLRADRKALLRRGRAGNGSSGLETGLRNARRKIHLGSAGAQQLE